jgi:hypothetical protein
MTGTDSDAKREQARRAAPKRLCPDPRFAIGNTAAFFLNWVTRGSGDHSCASREGR